MSILKDIKWQSVIYSLFYIAIGIVLLLFPKTTATTVCYVAGGSAIIAGLIIVCIYLFRDARKNAYRNDFVCGLLAVLMGVFIICRVDLVLGLTPFILGIAVMVSGFIKLQNCIDVRRMGYGNGLTLFLLALVNVVLGIILIIDPFGTTIVLFVIIGIGLIFSGISDLFATIYLSGKVKDFLNDMNLPDLSVEEMQDKDEIQNKEEEKADNETQSEEER
ncbi:MAG TPA: DUF308 domain-containing protein [Lachnospiraceae bacterium]|nr:DUF308 domain-containing protein [Lachnospiraceae bacterium]